MDGEAAPAKATIEQALFWIQIYTEILAMEEKVLVACTGHSLSMRAIMAHVHFNLPNRPHRSRTQRARESSQVPNLASC